MFDLPVCQPNTCKSAHFTSMSPSYWWLITVYKDHKFPLINMITDAHRKGINNKYKLS